MKNREEQLLMGTVIRDLRFALRTLARKPGFTLTVIGTLALALGANAAVFAIVDALVLNPFPVPGIERLVQLWETVPERGEDRSGVAPANFLDWQNQAQSFERLAGYSWWDANFSGHGEAERLQGTLVTPGFLEVLGVTAAAGRLLSSVDAAGQESTVVLSHSFWTRRFGRDPEVVGSEVLINGERYTIVGVAEENFEFPWGCEVWGALLLRGDELHNRTGHYLDVIGKLKEGAEISQAQRELDVIASRLASEFPESNGGRGVRALELSRAVVDIGAPAFLAVWQTTVVCILLIACINIAGLLLARGSDRYREMSLRTALGAGRWRIVRQLLTENLLLALSGGFLALPLAWFGLRMLRSGMPAHIRRFVVGWDQIDVDLRLLFFTIALAVVATLIFGLAPAINASRANLTESLREGGRGASEGAARQRWRTLMVIGEVSLALTLLVAAALSVQGTLRLAAGDQGYRPDGVMTAEIDLPEKFYPDDTGRRRFYERLVESLGAAPGVEAAAAANTLPSSGSGRSTTVEIEGQPVIRDSERPVVHYRVITPGYFETLRIPLLTGRNFSAVDREGAPPVVIVSRKMAEQFWPGQEAIGRRLRFGSREERPLATVVGVAGDVIHDWFLGGPRPTLFAPLSQVATSGMRIALRTSLDPGQAAALIRQEVKRIDPNQPVFNESTMTQLLWDRVLGLRYAAIVMAILGVLGLMLSAVGLYALMSYSVSRRTHEIGVRVALGAGRRQVLSLILSRGVFITSIGLAVGLLLAWGAGRLMESALFGTISLDLATYLIFASVLAAVSLLASYLPARRALRIDPVEALRIE